MRALAIACLTLLPISSAAEIRTTAACQTAIADTPETAREDAADWVRSGGGVEARLCEATALQALGATGTAAVKLTELGQDTSVVMDRDLRARIFEDAARLWRDRGQLPLAAETIDAALDLSDIDPIPKAQAGILRARLMLAADILVVLENWDRATQHLTNILTSDPQDIDALLLRSASLIQLERFDAALKDAETAWQADDTPRTAIARAKALQSNGQLAEATQALFEVIEGNPGTPAADQARLMLQSFAAN